MISFGSINTDIYSPIRSEHSNNSSDGSTKTRLTPNSTQKIETEADAEKTGGSKNVQELSAEEIRELTELKQRDREVKAHEQAHIAAGGAYVRSGAQYEYEKGPDGKEYAVGGEVQIDTSKVSGDSEATLKKMQTIRGAAMAPASPSAQDRKVAAQATQIENQARMEMLTRRYEEAATLRSGPFETESDDASSPDMSDRSPAAPPGALIDITG